MQDSGAPAKIPLPWGSSAGAGYINTIPTPSQIGITNGRASFTDGFPPLNFQPSGSGGVFPFGGDFNGVLNQITAGLQWLQGGGPMYYDAAFATAIDGYPKGAIIASTTLGVLWQSIVDNNSSNPDAGGAGWSLLLGRIQWDASAPPAADISLQPREQALITYENVTALPLKIATPSGGGKYRISLTTTATNTTNADIILSPNNASYANAFQHWVINPVDAALAGLGSAASLPVFDNLTTPANFPGEIGNVAVVSSNTDGEFYFDLFLGPVNSNNDVGPWMLELDISTVPVAKAIMGRGFVKGGPSIHGSQWNDTVTAWTSLGTIADARGASLSGTAVVERIF